MKRKIYINTLKYKCIKILEEKAILFGFSRGGLYAYNYALYYPESVAKMYLDAPVLNLRTWPWNKGRNHDLFCKEYNVNEETFATFRGSPVDTVAEFAQYDIPLLIVAGDKDESVPIEKNTYVFEEYYCARIKIKCKLPMYFDQKDLEFEISGHF